jgi:hypothetical protein
MTLLTRYDTPAFLPDFNTIPGQLEAWNKAVSAWFDQNIADDQQSLGLAPLQYYNAASFDPGGVSVVQEITWNAFPKELLRRYGRERALVLADRLWPIESYHVDPPDPDNTTGTNGILYRPQEEYCEWHVLRQPDSGRILRVTFTSEPPEYWQALFGVVPGSTQPPIIEDQHFPGDTRTLLRLYHELVSPDVKLEDLIAPVDLKDGTGQVLIQKGQYNFYSKWNTTLGIAHLNSPPNSLVAEIKLGADASVLYTDPKGRLLVEPEALIAYARYGGINRNSDPTIGASVNALARLGAYVTLRNPVGLYMDHIDLSGWEAPDKKGVSDCIRIVRGSPGMIERMVVEVPEGRNFNLGDITIAGVPIRYGGQIAECITVKLTGIANILPNTLPRAPVGAVGRTAIDPNWPLTVTGATLTDPIPPGFVEAFLNQGTGDPAPQTMPAASAPTARAMVPRAPVPRTRVAHSRFRF